jgi:hypothetical protein
VNRPRDGKAELDFRIADGVPADDGTLRGHAAFRPAGENLAEPLHAEFVIREADEVHGGDGRAAHRVDIRERIGRRDLPVNVGVIDDGGEEVQRLNQRDVWGNTVDARVVVRFGADEQVGVAGLGEEAQNLSNTARRQFPRSPRTGGEIGQSRHLFESIGQRDAK